MPQDRPFQIDYGPPADQSPKARVPSKPDGGFTIEYDAKPESSQSKAPGPPSQEVEKPKGSFLTRPVSESLFGTSAVKQYGDALGKMLPESIKKKKGAGWWARFVGEAAKGGPEILDFIQSPVGMTLAAAHLFPATATLASYADLALGGLGMIDSMPQFSKAASSGEPEDWADAVKTLAMSYGAVKMGSRIGIANAIKYRSESLGDREALRSRIQTQPAKAAELAKVATKYKSVPVEAIVEIARRPLSDIESDQKKAREKFLKIRTDIQERAKGEKREVTFAERRVMRDAMTPVRMLRDIAKVTLPEKVAATETARREASLSRTQKLYYNAFLREPAKLINIPKPRLMQVSADIVFDKVSRMGQRESEINRMLYDWKQVVPLEDRSIQKMGYVIQGSATPDEVGLSPNARRMLPVIQEWTRNQDEILRAAYGDDMSLQDAETYLTQVWKPKNGEWNPESRQRAARTLMKDPFLKKKVIESYKHGIEELGLEPKFNDVFDLLKMRADFATKAIENRRMAQWLRDLGVILSEPEYLKLRVGKASIGETPQTHTGVPYGSNARRANEWQLATEATALYRAAYSDKPLESGMMAKPVYVHPDYADAANAVFGERYDGRVFNGLDVARSLGKKVALNFSMFHNWALSEQAHAIYATRRNPLTTLSKTFFFNPDFYRGIKSGAWEAIGRKGDAPPVMRPKPELVSDMFEHGLSLKSEEQEHFLYRKLQDMAMHQNTFLRSIGKATKPVAKVLAGWDRALWDYYHQGMMMDAYSMLSSDMVKTDMTPAQVKETKRAIAEHVNNAFGAMNYEKMLVSPKMRQALNFFLLAPSWTFSNLRVLSGGYENEASHKLIGRYVAGAAASWFVTTQALNYATSAWYHKQNPDRAQPAHFTWENIGSPLMVGGKQVHGLTENAFNIFAGYNRDGSERYVVLGKGFREPMLWATDPFNMFWGKVSLPVRGAIVQATGATPGSGFREIDISQPMSRQLPERIKSGLDAAGVPFVFREGAQNVMHKVFPEEIPEPRTSGQIMGLPTRKGLSSTRAELEFTSAMDDGDGDRAYAVLSAAAANNVDVSRIENAYFSRVRRRQRNAAGPPVEYDSAGRPVQK